MPRLSLRYPNGRSHELDYEGTQRFHAGDEFELYGRRWRVRGIERPRSHQPVRVVHCEPLTDSPLARAGEARAAGSGRP